MTTLERPREAIHSPAPPVRRSSRRWIVMALVAALALAAGSLGGWMIRGNDTETPAIVLAGEGDLTTRQEQMRDLVVDLERA